MSKMAHLDHWPRGHVFDIMRSEVAAWLIDQPECRQEVFNWARRLGAIEYDLDSGTWRGIYYFNGK